MIRISVSRNSLIRFITGLFISGLALVFPVKLYAQTPVALNNAPAFDMQNYQVLPDAHYSFNRILTDTTLVFKTDSLTPAVSDYCWIKIIVYNPYPNDEKYLFSPGEPLNYTLYYFDANTSRWISYDAGPNAANGRRTDDISPCVFNKQAKNVLYLKIDLRDIKGYGFALNPEISIEKELVYNTDEKIVTMVYMFCCIVLISFLSYNLYIYFHLKDKAYLYYVILQAGTLVYYTGNHFFLNVVLPLRRYSMSVLPGGTIYYYTLNDVFQHVGVTIILWGFVQFVRSYLGTKKLFPVCDRVLQLLAYAYVVVDSVPVITTITGLYYLNNVVTDNVLIVVVITACMATGIIAYRHKVRAAKYFLVANLPPAFFAATASVHILQYNEPGLILPALAILSQIITFAVALVARIKLIDEDLKAKEIRASQLEADIKVTEYVCLLIEQENRNIALTMALEKEKNSTLQQHLATNQRELVGKNLYIDQKNRLLADVKEQINDIDLLYPHVKSDVIKGIQSSLKDGQYMDAEWDKFKLHFEQVHPDFFKNLQAEHPSLTNNEQRLHAYFHLNLSTKEIAAMLHIQPGSVKQAKARLKIKMSRQQNFKPE